jgi:hypothetical protein
MQRMMWSLAACLAVLAGPARADVLYSNLGPSDSYDQNFGWGEQGVADYYSERQAFSFTVSTDTRFDSARLALGLVSGANEIDLQLRFTINGHPSGYALETIHASGQMPPFGMYSSGHLVEFNSSQHTLLQAGQTYWLLPFPVGNTYARWNFNAQGRYGLLAESREVQPVRWQVGFATESAYEVNGTPSPAPEPSSLGLAGVCAVGLLGFAWRHRRKPAVA